MSLRNSIFVILRSAKERSLPLAINAVSYETSLFTVIEEYPFSAALKKMFTIAKERPEPYIVALDADVILYPGSLEKIAQAAHLFVKKFPELFFLDFFVMDKFRGKCCSGCHLYVNQYSKSLLSHMVFDQDDTRPENHLMLDFSHKNHLMHEKSSLIVGLHDFEQYYQDLYAKYFRRALRRKHEAEMLITILEERKKYYLQNDYDFTVALKGLHDGIVAGKINRPLFDARVYQRIEEILPLQEKDALFP